MDAENYQRIVELKRDVDARIVYEGSENQLKQLPDWTWVAGQSHGSGDCTVFAATYYHELAARGIAGVRCVGKVWSRRHRWQQHAWTEVAPYTLDCRFPGELRLISEGGYFDIDCHPHSAT